MDKQKMFFATGAKRDPKDNRDLKIAGITLVAEVPKQIFVLDEQFPPKMQYARGSCTSQAQSHHKERQEKRKSAARFVMALTKQLEGNTGYGAYCLDDETEVLTVDGWKKRQDFNVGDKHFTVNLKTKELEIKKAVDKIEYDYNGFLVQFKNRSCDLLLTPNHKCITHYLNNYNDWRLKEAKDISTSDSFPLQTKGWRENKEKQYDDNLIELIGWIVAEGSYEKQKIGNISRINITQNSGDNLDRIVELCNNLQLNFSLQTRKIGNRCDVRIYADSARYIETILPKSKCLPLELILKLTYEQLIILRDAILSGDGYMDGTGHGLIQKDENIIDNFQILVSLIGNSSSKQRRIQLDKCLQ
jgi:ribonucleoside-triphosphate reductase